MRTREIRWTTRSLTTTRRPFPRALSIGAMAMLASLMIAPAIAEGAAGWPWLEPVNWPMLAVSGEEPVVPDWSRLGETGTQGIFVYCRGCTFDSADWEALKQLSTKPISLEIPDSHIEDWEGLAKLDGRIQHLGLEGVQLDNDALDAIAALHSLRSLDLSSTGIRTPQLPRLLPLTGLRLLRLANNPLRNPERREWTEAYIEYPNRGDRVAVARREKQGEVQAMFEAAGVEFPPKQQFFRVFKREKELEVWAASERKGPLTHIATYTICDSSGTAGPKTEEGDLQVPEGFYKIDGFNERSAFFLSMHVSYPNEHDRARQYTGSAIMIHGACCSVGCLAMSDERIMELFLMARARRPQIHIHPRRDLQSAIQEADAAGDTALAQFWKELEKGNTVFEATGQVPRVEHSRGRYIVPDWSPELAQQPPRHDQGIGVLDRFPLLAYVDLAGTPVAPREAEKSAKASPPVPEHIRAIQQFATTSTWAGFTELLEKAEDRTQESEPANTDRLERGVLPIVVSGTGRERREGHFFLVGEGTTEGIRAMTAGLTWQIKDDRGQRSRGAGPEQATEVWNDDKRIAIRALDHHEEDFVNAGFKVLSTKDETVPGWLRLEYRLQHAATEFTVRIEHEGSGMNFDLARSRGGYVHFIACLEPEDCKR
jgi:hypothetical protein